MTDKARTIEGGKRQIKRNVRAKERIMGCQEKENNGNYEKKIHSQHNLYCTVKKTHVFHTTFRFHHAHKPHSARGKVLLTNETDFFCVSVVFVIERV